MEINRTTDYAVQVALHLAAGTRGQRVTSAHIARGKGIPLNYVPKIRQTLGRAGILTTRPGRTGGVQLLRPPETLTVLPDVLGSTPSARTRIIHGFQTSMAGGAL